MKGLIAWIVGVALTASSVVTPSVIADENGEVHYWTSGSTYAPSGGTVRYVNTETGETVAAVPVAASDSRVYLVLDDPTYDLSGAGDRLFLVGEGSAFHGGSERSAAVFAATGGVPHEVASVPAEYRQDWLAVSAGDRPVRAFTVPRSAMDTGRMAGVSTGMTHANGMPDNDHYASRQTDTFRPVHHPRRRAYVHRRVHSARLSADWRRERRHRASYSTAARREREDEPVMPTASNAEAVAMAEPVVVRDELGHEIFQIGSSWYMKDNGEWLRAESWRGPFIHVKEGTVPREVRMSADHPSHMDKE